MNKRLIPGLVIAGILLVSAIASASTHPQTSDSNTTSSINTNSITKGLPEKVKPACDGTIVTTHCAVDGISYTTYTYHPAIAEKSHTETVTTYSQKVTGYCTLCSDGTYSPSCATGRGACSHHGGVAQWNAPRYSNVPTYSTKNVVDAAAQEAYYERVAE